MPCSGGVSCRFAGGGVAAGGWLARGGGAGWAGVVEEEDPAGAAGVSPAPIPGVMGPCTPGNAVGACGVGASGTGVCCWARTPDPKTSPTPRSAASAMAFPRAFTAISSSHRPIRTPTHSHESHGTGRNSQSIRRSRRLQVVPAGKQSLYAFPRGSVFV